MTAYGGSLTSQCPCMLVGLGVVVSRLHADAACLKMDVCKSMLMQLIHKWV